MKRETKISFCVSLALHIAVYHVLNISLTRPPSWGMAFGQTIIEVKLVAGTPPAPSKPVAPPKPAAPEKPKPPEPKPEPKPEPVVTPPEPVPAVEEPVMSVPEPVETASADIAPQEAPPEPKPVAEPPPEPAKPAQPAGRGKGDHGKGVSEADYATLAKPGVAWISDVRYRRNPAPQYPVKAIIQKIEGLVYLVVDIDPSGRPSGVAVHKSSGSFLLDDAALKAVWRWEFEPAMDGGIYVKSRTLIPVEFELMTRSEAVRGK